MILVYVVDASSNQCSGSSSACYIHNGEAFNVGHPASGLQITNEGHLYITYPSDTVQTGCTKPSTTIINFICPERPNVSELWYVFNFFFGIIHEPVLLFILCLQQSRACAFLPTCFAWIRLSLHIQKVPWRGPVLTSDLLSFQKQAVTQRGPVLTLTCHYFRCKN